jgi:hypothetical protein
MNEVRPFLLVSLDTECDKTATWRTASPLRFSGVTTAIPEKLQPLFADFGIRPTYLLSPEVIAHPESCAVLREARDCELGTHLHGDYIMPEIKTWDFAGTVTGDMQCRYPPRLESAKLAVLTELFIQQFGFAPGSFRAGRFGVGHYTARFLAELGYLVDSSVTPHVCWSSGEGKAGPDFRQLDEMPYTVGRRGDIWRHGKGGLLEVPVTILPAGTLEGANSSQPAWFRPSYSDAAGLIRVMDCVLEQPPERGVYRPLVMMFHNVEVLPGASPYCQTEDDVARYLDSLKRVFEHAEKRGIRSCTMTEYHDAFMERRSGIQKGAADAPRSGWAFFRRAGRRRSS